MKVESRMVGVRGCGQVLNRISVMLRSCEFPLCYCIEEGLWIAVVSYACLNAGGEDSGFLPYRKWWMFEDINMLNMFSLI